MNDIGSWAQFVVACFAIAGAFVGTVRWLLKRRDEVRQAKAEFAALKDDLAVVKSDVKTVWTALCRRGLVRAKMSPYLDAEAVGRDRVSERARELFAETGLAGELRAWWRRTWRNKGPSVDIDEALLDMERLYGERITNEICEPLEVYDLECLQIGLIIAREDHGSRQRRTGDGLEDV